MGLDCEDVLREVRDLLTSSDCYSRLEDLCDEVEEAVRLIEKYLHRVRKDERPSQQTLL